MKKIRMCVDTDKTFAEGFEEYILDCKSRNLRDGTLRHYRESIKQIYKRVPPDTLISDLDEYTMPDFIVALRDDPNLNDVSNIVRETPEEGYVFEFVTVSQEILDAITELRNKL